MKLYGKKFTRQAINKKTKSVQETRDAILWDILTENNTCRVKIQGTNEFIIAHYPRNWQTVPYWLKPGNAVRILHRAGNRGYVEVIGEGRAIPSPLPGGEAMPDEQSLPDGVVTGCDMTAMGTAMGVSIAEGTYRIDGVIYSLTIENQSMYYDTEDCAFYDSDSDQFYISETMGSGSFALDPAPAAGSFRYDAFCVGTDGVIEYVKGTSSSTPETPALPSNKILLGSYIFVIGGSDVINEEDIGCIWTAKHAAEIVINIEGDGFDYEMPWLGGYDPVTNETATADISLSLIDQYGWYISSDFVGTVTQNSGGGELSLTELSFQGSTTIHWVRDQTVVDTDIVVFTVSGIANEKSLTSVGMIFPESYDIGGE